MSGKNILMFFAPQFDDFGCDVAQALVTRCGGGRVHGLCTGSADVYERVARKLDNIGGDFWQLPKEERVWLSTPASINELERLERELGPGAFGRIVTADRRIGRGFVRGGLLRPDPLGRLAVRDPSKTVQRYVSGLYRFLDAVLRVTAPDIVFSYAVAGAPAVALAELCGARGISFCRMTPTRIGDKHIVDTDLAGRQASIARRFERARDGREPFSLSALDEARQHVEAFRAKPVQPGYVRRAEPPRLFRELLFLPFHCLKTLARGHSPAIDTARLFFKCWIAWRRMFARRKWFSSSDALPSSFIYFPLHVDPEASTMVLSPWHTDQLAVIEALAKAAPAHMHIVVKEHPPMLGRRPRGFYRQIATMPRVMLLAPDHSTFDLVKRAALTAVITGTAAWEAVLLGKPALIIGDSPFLPIAAGLVYEPNLTQLPKAINTTLSLPPASQELLALYIAAATAESFDMPSSMLWGTYSSHSAAERRAISEMIANAIVKSAEAT